MKKHNNKAVSSDIDIDFDSDISSDSESSYEHALLKSIQTINNNAKNKDTSSGQVGSNKTHRNYTSNNSSSVSKSINNVSTEKRVEFIKYILDGNKLRPMIDFDNYTEGEEYAKLNKKTMDVCKLFNTMNIELEYIKSGATGHTFKAKSASDTNIAFAVKVCAYPKSDDYGSINNSHRPENAELRMLKLLSSFVLKMKTPHFILPIGTFNTSIGPFYNIEKKIINLEDGKNEAYRKFVKKCENGRFEDLVSVLISEWANGGDLLDYIRKNYEKMTLKHWTVIFFQILYTLASLHGKYESFRHNDMKANNILVVLSNTKSEGKEYAYRLEKTNIKFHIPDIGIQIKIWDFDFACIDGIIENNKVNSEWAAEMNVSKKRNQYYDMHFFFNTLICKPFFPQFYKGGAPKEIIEFIHRIIPEKYRSVSPNKYIRKVGRILVENEYTTPFKVIMEDNLFYEYRFMK
jgi:hypothetical protein